MKEPIYSGRIDEWGNLLRGLEARFLDPISATFARHAGEIFGGGGQEVVNTVADIEAVEIVFKDGVGYDPAKLLYSVRGLVGLR